MKLKKILSAIVASVMAVSAVPALTAFAVEDGQATYCFDTDAKVEDWITYGSVEEVAFKAEHTNKVSKNGNGSLIISEKSEGDVSDKFGGFYIDAATFGLQDFRGCTVEMSFLLCEDAKDFTYDNLSVFCDGLVWVSAPVTGLSSDEWKTVTLTVPENAENPRIGITIPTFNAYSGDIIYLDDVSVTKSDGTAISNLGDYEIRSVAAADAVSTGTNIGLTVLLVVLILAIVGGIGLIVSAAIRKFV